MIYFCDAAGSALRCVPERVYQGSSEASFVTLVAPFSESAQMSVGFRLPNGEKSEKYYMSYAGMLDGFQTKKGERLCSWRASLPASVTSHYGRVTAQFYQTGSSGEIIATSPVQFTVERGVDCELPAMPVQNIYEQILAVIAQICADVQNAAYAARAIYAWNSEYTYGANEITLCPDANGNGTFVKSLAENNTAAPYGATGELNAQYWEEVCRFDELMNKGEEAVEAAQIATAAADVATEKSQVSMGGGFSPASESTGLTWTWTPLMSLLTRSLNLWLKQYGYMGLLRFWTRDTARSPTTRDTSSAFCLWSGHSSFPMTQ